MEKLIEKLSRLKAESDVATITNTFEEIAKILLYKSRIKTGHGSYRILEIEFYFKNNKHNDNVTIERTEEAGMWWLHDYGVDLSFKSVEAENYYGGILIRSMMPLADNQIDKEVIFGPRKCCWHLFYSSAIQPYNVPQIVINDGESQDISEDTPSKIKRYLTRKPKATDGDYRDSEYRFYVKGLEKSKIDPSYKKASPWK